jgi:hypothetical protein
VFTLTRPTGRSFAVLVAIAMFALIVTGCGGDDDDDDGNNGSGGDTQGTATAVSDDDGGDEPEGSGGGDRTGTFTLGDETWTFVASLQCGIFPGPIVAISGNAAEDADIELLVDFDEDSDLVQAAANTPEGTWLAENEDVSIEVDGSTVSGQGTFREFITGDTAEGSFEISC